MFSLVFCCLCIFHTTASAPSCFAHQVWLCTSNWGSNEWQQGLRESTPKILLVGKQGLGSLVWYKHPSNVEDGKNLVEQKNAAQLKGVFQRVRRKSGINYRQHRLFQSIHLNILSCISRDLVCYFSTRIFSFSSGWIGQYSLQKWLNYLFFSTSWTQEL